MSLLRKAGIDRAVGMTLLGNGWSGVSGLVTLLLLTHFLTPVEQGFYYTFAGFLSATVLFDLAVSYVALQYASHERAHLEWTPQGTLTGDPVAKMRLASLLRMSLLWYGVVALVIIAAWIPAGLLFFGRHAPPVTTVAWEVPWIWITVVSAGTLALSPLLAVMEGCGLVAQIATLRTVQNVASSFLLWLALLLGWGLYAAPMPGMTILICGLGWIGWKQRPFLRDLLSPAAITGGGGAVFRWREEVWPFQWRMALSGICGYVIFQMFTPVLFAARGPVEAGRMGLSLTIMQVIASLAMSWMTTKMQRFGTLAAGQHWAEMDHLFFSNLWRSWAVAAAGVTAFCLLALLVSHLGYPISRRLLGPLPLALLGATTIVNHAVGAQALYLRAHRREPMLGVSLAVAALVGASNLLLPRQYGATGMMLGYLLVTLFVGLGGATWLFVTNRRRWHLAPSAVPRETPAPR